MPHLATPRFGRLTKTAVTAVAAGATIVALTVPAAAAPQASEKPKTTTYGKALKLYNVNYDHTILRVRVGAAPKTVPNKLLQPYAHRPKNGRLVYIHANFKSFKGRPSVNPLYFYIVPAKGKPIGADLGLIKNELDASNPKKGKTESGNIAFHLKPGTKIRKVSYDDALDNPAGFWH